MTIEEIKECLGEKAMPVKHEGQFFLVVPLDDGKHAIDQAYEAGKAERETCTLEPVYDGLTENIAWYECSNCSRNFGIKTRTRYYCPGCGRKVVDHD